MNIVVVVQARTSSTRLPGKVLLPLAGRPLLERMLQRVQAARTNFTVVVATTTNPDDQPIRDLCAEKGIICYSGHPTDLLDRHYRAARSLLPDAVAKIPSDCPLIDPAAIDRVLEFYLAHHAEYDFVSNLHPPTWPDGNDVEVVSLAALQTAWKDARTPVEREHTTPFLWGHAERFRIGNVEWETGLDYSATHRWTIDYPEDYTLINAIYNELWLPWRPVFSTREILDLLQAKPELSQLNARFAGTYWYSNLARTP